MRWLNLIQHQTDQGKKILQRSSGNLMIYAWECAIENTGVCSVIRIWSCTHTVIYCTYCATLCSQQISDKLTFTNTEPVLFCKYVLHQDQAQYYATLHLGCIFKFFFSSQIKDQAATWCNGLMQLFYCLQFADVQELAERLHRAYITCRPSKTSKFPAPKGFFSALVQQWFHRHKKRSVLNSLWF